ncbi:hypothetical protein NCS52_00177400 [Fusarium sp. LHS14.1]|nr:hypothetical protein NCS52_00177400 [Fusarium sp. LHS14.1]
MFAPPPTNGGNGYFSDMKSRASRLSPKLGRIDLLALWAGWPGALLGKETRFLRMTETLRIRNLKLLAFPRHRAHRPSRPVGGLVGAPLEKRDMLLRPTETSRI